MHKAHVTESIRCDGNIINNCHYQTTEYLLRSLRMSANLLEYIPVQFTRATPSESALLPWILK